MKFNASYLAQDTRGHFAIHVVVDTQIRNVQLAQFGATKASDSNQTDIRILVTYSSSTAEILLVSLNDLT